jgi:tripartite-type tricarboxylate transporter receptor subunit TctC
MMVGNPQVPARTLAEAIDFAKRNSGKVNCASGNTNGVVFCELFRQRLNADVMGVPYKSTSPALTDLIGGQVQFMFVDLPSGAPRVRAGQVTAYAVTALKRSAILPDVPTMAEAGLPNFPDNSGWWGLYGPANLPQPIAAKLTAALDDVLKREDVKTKLHGLGVEVSTASPQEMDRYLRSQLEDWRKFLKDFNIQPEN